MKTVLIPTDFSLQSLNIIKTAVTRFAGEQLQVVLFHALHLPTDIQDLLFLNKQAPQEKITEAFRHTCAAIKKKHSDRITGITFKSMYGNTAGVFSNFLEANAVDIIFWPEHITLRTAYRDSVEMHLLFKNATVPFITTTRSATTHTISVTAFDKDLQLAE